MACYRKFFPIFLGCPLISLAQTPAFPGALGFGAAATGGRGATVVHVTNLDNSGPGSFRDAVSVANRTVVFDVGGYITISTEVGVKSNITIAGQTAPGGGIAIRGAEVTFGNQSNIICRYMRFRPGASSGTTQNGLSLYQARNVMLDHCSVAFAKWNNIDAVSEDWQNKPVNNITVQNCMITNPIGQQFAAHTECPEGTWSWFGNIFANGHNRQPLAKIHTIFINNTIYNYSAGYTTHTSTRFKHDIINNYFIGGPASAGTDNTWFQMDNNQSIYYTGNLKDRNNDGVLNGTTTIPNWYQGGTGGTVLTAPWSPVTTAILASATPPLSAANAVVRNNCDAGALPRDEMDNLALSQVKRLGNGPTGHGAGTAGPSGGLYTSQAQTGLSDNGFGAITAGILPVDSDRDGMPDDWEAAKGLNATNAADGRTIIASGYSNLEEYLHWLALPHAFVAKNTPTLPTSVTLDLQPYADGFPAGTGFTLSGITGGTATLAGSVVTFTPTVNTSGIGGFSFSITSNGYTWTRTAGVLISPNPTPRSIRWQGDGATNAWTSARWQDIGAGGLTSFANGDRVYLDATGSAAPALQLTGTQSPGYLEKSGSLDYTIAGTGTLSGAMALRVNGPGLLTLHNSAANSYAGGTYVQDATLRLAGTATTLGSGPLTMQGDATLESAFPAGNTLQLSANMIKVEEGDTANLLLSAKTALGGGEGKGTVNIRVPGTATGTSGDYLNGSWSGFSGDVNITGTTAGAHLEMNINGGGFTNMGLAHVSLDGVKIQSRHNSAGNTISFGALQGTSTSQLGGSSYAGAATYQIGGRSEASVFSGTIADGVVPTIVTKTGSATLNLRGPRSYTGATNVLGGTLYASGAFTGLINVTGGSLSPGDPTTSVFGQVQANGGLTLDDGTLSLDITSSPTGLNDKVTCPTGTTTTLNGTNTFRIKFADGYLRSGTYGLIDGNSTLVRESGVVLNYTSPQPTGSRQTLSIVRNSSTAPVPAFVNLVVTGDVANLTWSGANGGLWDLSTTQAWTSTATTNPNLFYNFDSVNFTDTSTVSNVVLTGTLAPRTVTVSSNTRAYQFTGTGILSGIATLTKTGNSILTISTSASQTFTGGTTVEAGTLLMDTAAATPLGTGPLTLAGGTLNLGVGRTVPNNVIFTGPATITSTSGNVALMSDVNSLSGAGDATFAIATGICTLQGSMANYTGTLRLGSSNGMLRLNGGTNANFGSAQAAFDLGTGNAILANRNGGVTIAFGSLAGGPNTTLQGRQSGSGATASNYLIGALNTDATFAGHIVSGGDTNGLNITKQGTGNWTLTGTSTFTGDITVQAGKLTITSAVANSGNFVARSGTSLVLASGSITTPTVEIEAGATMEVCGMVNGDIVNHGTLLIRCPAGCVLNGGLENHGLVLVTQSSRLTASGAIENSGTLDLLGSPATVLPTGTQNTGLILYAGDLEISAISKTGGTVTLSIQTAPHRTYTLEATHDLTQPWVPVTTGATQTTTAQGLRTWTLTSQPAERKFYRVASEP